MLKLFFKILRPILGTIIVTADKLFPPKSITRSTEAQETVNTNAKLLSLYQFASCPFCIKVRRQSKSLNIPLETRNVLKNKDWHEELEQEGGKRKVPCLRIERETGIVEWLYESKAINAYLQQNFAA
jgi:glutaredoxin